MTRVDFEFFQFLLDKGINLTFNNIIFELCAHSDASRNFLIDFMNKYISPTAFDNFQEFLLERHNKEYETAMYKYSLGAEFGTIVDFCELFSEPDSPALDILDTSDFLLNLLKNRATTTKFHTLIKDFSKVEGFDDEKILALMEVELKKRKYNFEKAPVLKSPFFNSIIQALQGREYISINLNENIAPTIKQSVSAEPKKTTLASIVAQKRKTVIPREQLANVLKESVIGQDEICDEVAKVVYNKVNGIQLIDKRTPIARLLFCGPSGVGKTELAKAIAKEFFPVNSINNDNPITESIKIIPCSTYTSEVAANKLFGSEPSYVGYGDETALVSFLMKLRDNKQQGVIVFDEIEKMHPKAQNSLLSVLDGIPFDFPVGKKNTTLEQFDFKNVLVIATSNLASNELAKKINKLGFGDNQNENIDKLEIIKNAAAGKEMSDEFFGRFDKIYTFNNLNDESYLKIAKQKFHQSLTEISRKFPELKIKLHESAIKLIALKTNNINKARKMTDTATNELEYLINQALLEGTSDIENTEYVLKGNDNDLYIVEITIKRGNR